MIPKNLLVMLLPVALLAGCGGGGGGTGDGGLVEGATVEIEWPAQTRDGLSGPRSAFSALITLKRAAKNAGDVILTVERPASVLQDTRTSYTLPIPVRKGTTDFGAIFYAEHNGQGDVVAFATAQVTVAGTGTSFVDLVLDSVVKKVVAAGHTFEVGDEPFDLTFTAYGPQSKVLAIAPGSATWACPNGNPVGVIASADGRIQPVSPSTNQFTATVDGVTSAPVKVIVNAAPPASH